MNRNSLNKSYLVLFPIFIFLVHLPFVFARSHESAHHSNTEKIASLINRDTVNTANAINKASIYNKLQLNTLGLSKEAFDYAIKGYRYLLSSGMLSNENVLSIVDFSLPSSKKRLFVIDMQNLKVLFNTYVAHGRNSGTEYANNFSNAPESHKSSLGFYITKSTYNGEHGFSLQLEGEEKGINDNAFSRAIVIHSAPYVDESLVKRQGYIGRSFGCPALPEKYSKAIIQTIKDGSCFFMFSPNSKYISKSTLLQSAS